MDAAAGHQAGPGVRGPRRLQDIPLWQLGTQHSLLLPGEKDIWGNSNILSLFIEYGDRNPINFCIA